MSTKAIFALLAFLFTTWIINMIVIDNYGRDRELYPMTAWQMFSGRPKTAAIIYTFEIVSVKDAQPVELPGKKMFYPVEDFGQTPTTRRVLTAVHKSHDYGCPDYRLKNYNLKFRISDRLLGK